MNRKIAIPVDENGILNDHFGHSRYFEIFTVNDTLVLEQQKMVAPPHKPGVLPKWIAEMGVTDVLVGGMGENAEKILVHRNIHVFRGTPKLPASDLVNGFLADSLEFKPEACHHHHH